MKVLSLRRMFAFVWEFCVFDRKFGTFIFSDDCESWMTNLTRRLRDIGQLHEGGNDYSVFTPLTVESPLYTPINRSTSASTTERYCIVVMVMYANWLL